MRVLIGGEYSGVIRDAFTSEGHYAMSADFSDTLSEGPHYKGNWWDVMDDGWDLAIFHPTCTFMSNSSSKHLYNGMSKEGGLNVDRWVKMGQDAWALWDLGERCSVPKVAIENPIMLRYAQIMSGLDNRDKWGFQSVQPWWFGDDPSGPDNVKKATCWWTRGLPKLKPTGLLSGDDARADCHNSSPTKDPEVRRMLRSKMTPGMARAVAKQWGAKE